MAGGFDRSEVLLGEVEVRPVRADERRRWDGLMAAHHYLGFRQFAGRGLRHVAVWRGRAGPERLLDWNRSHWQVENANHYRRDATLGEDASRARVRHAPANNATINNIALALVFHRGFRYLPEAHLHFLMRLDQALDAILSPC